MWFRKKKRIETNPLDASKLLEAFSIPPETPLIQAILHVIKADGLISKELIKVPNLPDTERAFHAGGIAKCDELEERILDLIDKGQRMSQGTINRQDAIRDAEL